jgi:hypothetical protein
VSEFTTSCFFITGVSGEKVEVDPVGSKGAKFFKQRAMTYDADSIASCEILEEKSIGMT